jgi:RHS repeat-associated protein
MTLKRVALLVLISVFFLTVLLIAPVVRAQITDVTNSTSTPIPGAGHDYIKMLSESVSPANGSVSLRLSAPVPRGRRLTLPFGIVYDSNGVHSPGASNSVTPSGDVDWIADTDSFLHLGGWGYSVPYFTAVNASLPANAPQTGRCSYIAGYIFHDSNGGRHPLLIANQPNSKETACKGLSQTTGGGDGVYLGAIGGAGLRVTDWDGTVYNFSISPNGNDYVPGSAEIEDRNGNEISIAYSLTAAHPASFVVTDTLGRQLLSSSGLGAPTDTIQIAGLSEPYTITWGTTAVNFTPNATKIGDDNCGWVGDKTTISVVTAITMPNGQKYQFTYDPTFGTLSKITYPDGGYVSYTWGYNPQSAIAYWATNSKTAPSCSAIYDSPAILNRYVSFDGKSNVLEQTFKYSTTWNSNNNGWVTKQTTVTTDDLVRGTSFETDYTYSFITPNPQPILYSPSDNQIPVESVVVHKSTSGAILRTDTKGWATQYNLTCELHTLDNGSTLGTFYTYSTGTLVTDKKEYDYGLITAAGPCINGSAAPTGVTASRETVISYQPLAPTPIFPTSPSIRDRPASVISYGKGARVGETDYAYDQSAAGSASATAHDETNYGPASTVSRGNATTVTRQCFPGCANAVTTYTYDETGQVSTSMDPCGNTTCGDITGTTHTMSYAYGDSYSSCGGSAPPSGGTNAYLTKLTDALGHFQTFCYGYNDGQLRSATDPNAQTTTYSYVDSLDRLTNVGYPDGGKTAYSYDDAPPTPNVTTTKAMSASQSFTTVSTMDGVGHVTQTETTSITPGIFVNSVYDGLGRLYTVSNPHESTSSSTDGTTTYTYDALGRTTEVVEQDGSTVQSAYVGNTTTVTDEAGHKRENATDGLARLTTSWEPDSSNNLTIETSYTYDALDNLVGVVQAGSRPRSFVHDSLSRLTSSTNPESSTTTFTYDTNGNISSRKDARSITTTYGYDQLNRLTSRTYSDTTPEAVLSYDGAPCNAWTITVAMTNSIGRRTCESTFGGTNATETALSYDPMGRVLVREQCDPINCGTGAFFLVTHSYDLLGDLSQINYQLTNLAGGGGILYTYDGATRTTQVTSGDSTGLEPATLFTADATLGYWPNGSLRLAKYGNNLGVTSAYNSRLQPCRLDLNSSVKALSQCTDATPVGSLLDFSYGYRPGANNGNIASWTATGAQSFNRSYAYDQLNRLTSMTGPGGSCTGLTWSYDNWGNRTAQTPTVGSCPSLSKTANSLNQIVGYTYDAAGNLLNDGSHNYAYDAENRLTLVDGGTTASYLYDAEGQRVTRNTSTVSVGYLRDARGDVLAETEDDIWHNQYVYANGQLLAEYSGTAVYFDTQDHLGSSSLLTTVTGTVQDCNAFYPFGEQDPTICASTSTTTHKFTGKVRDSESNLDNFEARYMASSLGRFMSPDSKTLSTKQMINPQTLNKYAYTLNNPLRYFDPDGLEELTIQLRAFIPQANATVYKGDDRGPTTSQAVTSRTDITFRIQTDQSKLPVGYSPLLAPGIGKAGQTENLFTGSKATQQDGNGGVTSAKFDDKGNVVLTISQNSVNPLAPPGAAPIREDLTLTIPANGSTITTVGTISGSPSFELNVFGEGGSATNISLQTASSNPLIFITSLYQTNSIFNITVLPPGPPPACNQVQKGVINVCAD